MRGLRATVRRGIAGRVHGDWPSAQFAKRGIRCRGADKVKSEIYLAALPMMMAGKVELLDDARLINQLCGLERRTLRSGRDVVDHDPSASAHDDVANAAAGALVLAAARKVETWGPEAVIMGRPLAAAAHADFMKYGATGPRPASLFDQYDPRTAEGRANLADYQRTPWRW
jgi:hypothetical protein